MLSLESEETGQTDLASHSIISYQSNNLNPHLFISCSTLSMRVLKDTLSQGHLPDCPPPLQILLFLWEKERLWKANR